MNSIDLKTYKFVKISKSNFFTITVLSIHNLCSESKNKYLKSEIFTPNTPRLFRHLKGMKPIITKQEDLTYELQKYMKKIYKDFFIWLMNFVEGETLINFGLEHLCLPSESMKKKSLCELYAAADSSLEITAVKL